MEITFILMELQKIRNLFVVVVVLFCLLLVAVFFGIGCYMKSRLEKMLAEITEEIKEEKQGP